MRETTSKRQRQRGVGDHQKFTMVRYLRRKKAKHKNVPATVFPIVWRENWRSCQKVR